VFVTTFVGMCYVVILLRSSLTWTPPKFITAYVYQEKTQSQFYRSRRARFANFIGCGWCIYVIVVQYDGFGIILFFWFTFCSHRIICRKKKGSQE